MNRLEELKNSLSEKFPISEFVFSIENTNNVMQVPKKHIKEVMAYFKQNAFFDILMDLTAVDYLKFKSHEGPRYAVVYHLFNCI